MISTDTSDIVESEAVTVNSLSLTQRASSLEPTMIYPIQLIREIGNKVVSDKNICPSNIVDWLSPYEPLLRSRPIVPSLEKQAAAVPKQPITRHVNDRSANDKNRPVRSTTETTNPPRDRQPSSNSTSSWRTRSDKDKEPVVDNNRIAFRTKTAGDSAQKSSFPRKETTTDRDHQQKPTSQPSEGSRESSERQPTQKSRRNDDMWDTPGSIGTTTVTMTAMDQRLQFERERAEVLAKRHGANANPNGDGSGLGSSENGSYHREADDIMKQFQQESTGGGGGSSAVFSAPGSPEPSQLSPRDLGGGLLSGGAGPAHFSSSRSLTAAELMRGESSPSSSTTSSSTLPPSLSSTSHMFDSNNTNKSPFHLPFGTMGMGMGMSSGSGPGSRFPMGSSSDDFAASNSGKYSLTEEDKDCNTGWISNMLDTEFDIEQIQSVSSRVASGLYMGVGGGTGSNGSNSSRTVTAASGMEMSESVGSGGSGKNKSSRLSALLGLKSEIGTPGAGADPDSHHLHRPPPGIFTVEMPTRFGASISSGSGSTTTTTNTSNISSEGTCSSNVSGSAPVPAPRSISVTSLFSAAMRVEGGVKGAGGKHQDISNPNSSQGQGQSVPVGNMHRGEYFTNKESVPVPPPPSIGKGRVVSVVGGREVGDLQLQQNNSNRQKMNISATSRLQLLKMQQQCKRSHDESKSKSNSRDNIRVSVPGTGTGQAVEETSTVSTTTSVSGSSNTNNASKGRVIGQSQSQAHRPTSEGGQSSFDNSSGKGSSGSHRVVVAVTTNQQQQQQPVAVPVAVGNMQRVSVGALFARASASSSVTALNDSSTSNNSNSNTVSCTGAGAGLSMTSSMATHTPPPPPLPLSQHVTTLGELERQKKRAI
eukprot:gene5211-10430_t